MFKFLLLTFVFFYVLFRIGGFFMRVLFGRMQQPPKQSSYRKGDVFVNNQPAAKIKEKKNYSGGDYIDYEEVE